MFYRSLNAYLREAFGCKVYKLALSAGCTCPNRDGTIGTRGCIFCSGSGEFAASASLSIPEQLAQAKPVRALHARGICTCCMFWPGRIWPRTTRRANLRR